MHRCVQKLTVTQSIFWQGCAHSQTLSRVNPCTPKTTVTRQALLCDLLAGLRPQADKTHSMHRASMHTQTNSHTIDLLAGLRPQPDKTHSKHSKSMHTKNNSHLASTLMRSFGRAATTRRQNTLSDLYKSQQSHNPSFGRAAPTARHNSL